MSTLFDDNGRYRLTPSERTCTRCHRVLVDEDELGLYYQVPVQENFGPLYEGGPDNILTFMDRVHECDGKPHALPGSDANRS